MTRTIGRFQVFVHLSNLKTIFSVDVLMMAILDKQQLTGEQLKNKLEVITILGNFLRRSNNRGLYVPTWDREIDNGFSWLGWTVMNGTADDVAALIKSKQPYDPLLGKTSILMVSRHYKYLITYLSSKYLNVIVVILGCYIL